MRCTPQSAKRSRMKWATSWDMDLLTVVLTIRLPPPVAAPRAARQPPYEPVLMCRACHSGRRVESFGACDLRAVRDPTLRSHPRPGAGPGARRAARRGAAGAGGDALLRALAPPARGRVEREPGRRPRAGRARPARDRRHARAADRHGRALRRGAAQLGRPPPALRARRRGGHARLRGDLARALALAPRGARPAMDDPDVALPGGVRRDHPARDGALPPARVAAGDRPAPSPGAPAAAAVLGAGRPLRPRAARRRTARAAPDPRPHQPPRRRATAVRLDGAQPPRARRPAAAGGPHVDPARAASRARGRGAAEGGRGLSLVGRRTAVRSATPSSGDDARMAATVSDDLAAPHVLLEYALLADGERGILVGPRGEFAWMCFPRWDSEAIFASLIGGGGVFSLTPVARAVWGG